MINRAIFGAGNKLDLLLHFIQKDFPTGVTVIDPDGSLARAVLDIVPQADTERAFYFDPANHAASFNVFEDVSDKSKLVQDLCALFDALFPAGAETLTRLNSNFCLASALTVIADSPNATFTSILRFLEDENFRTDCIRRCKNPIAVRNWQAIEDWDRTQRKSAFAQIEAKVGTLLLSPVMFETLEQKCTHFLEHNDIVIADLSRSRIGDQASKLLGTLLISRARTPIYVNDFHFFSSDYLASLFSRGGHTVAIQFLSTLSQNVAQELLGFEEKFVFRTTPDDAERLKYSAGTLERRNIVDLGPSEFLPNLTIKPPTTTGRSQAVLNRSIACHTRHRDRHIRRRDPAD